MKNFLTILFLLATAGATAAPKNYYVSSSMGSNTNNGLSQIAAWQTLDKVNLNFGVIVAGDSILLKCGDTFYGSLIVTKSGVNNLPIVIASYGTGAKPIITGFTTLSGWTLLSTGIYQATATAVKPTVNLLTINGVPQAVGRYPNADATNAGYLQYETYSGTTSITDAQLTTTPNNWTGAEVVSRKNHWWTEKSLITNHTGGTLTYTPTGSINPLNSAIPPLRPGTNNYGYFIQRDIRTVDQQGEWYFNNTTKKMQVFFGANNPASYVVKVATQDTLINLGNKQFITINNIAFDGAGMFAVYGAQGGFITVKNCNVTSSGGKGILIFYSANSLIENCNLNNCLCSGIDLTSRHSPNATVRNCVVKNTGLFPGMGAYWDDNDYKGISVNVTTNGLIEYCQVDTTGHAGIQFQGNNFTIQYNLVRYACIVKDDAGGIYTYQSGSDASPGTTYTGRVIRNNIILNMPGCPLGAGGSPDVEGIYLDGKSQDIDILNNTVTGIGNGTSGHGIYCNSPKNVNIIANVIYGNAWAFGITRYSYANIVNLVIKKNICFAIAAGDRNFEYFNTGVSTPTTTTIQADIQALGTLDSNYWTTPNVQGFKYKYANTEGSGVLFPAGMSLEGWRTYSGKELASVRSTTNTSLINNHYNASNVSVPFNFSGFNKLEADGTNHSNSVNIPRWTAVPLIDNGASTNAAPTANAGANLTVNLPTNFTTLSGSGSDGDGTISSYKWIQTQGPSTASISNSNAASTLVTVLVQGTYEFELTVTDNGGAIGKDRILAVVTPSPNTPPTVNAGADKTITLPTSSVTLTATATDQDGTISSYTWVKLASSPAGGTIGTSTGASTLVNSLVAGVYKYKVTVTDNSGASATDTVQVSVNPAPNTPPTASAGVDIAITLPTNSTTLAGSGSDAEGPVTYAWIKVTGPAGGTTSATTAFAPVGSLQQGTYQYQLTVTDNSGATATDLVNVVVSASPPINTSPVSHAGSDIIITLPTSSVTLAGFGTDADGTISSVAWVKTNGPATGTIVTPSAGNSVFNNLVQGTYQLTLTVTDNSGATNGDVMQVVVNGAPVNILPSVTAGGDLVITLPTNSVNLAASATDADGTISSYAWLKILGPSATITTPLAASTSVTSMLAGSYKFEITVTDNSGGTDKDTVQVIVNPLVPNQAPTVDAGTDLIITLPTSSVSLTAVGTDTDGSVTGYQWIKTGGPVGGTIVTPNAATTLINNLPAGQHFYQVTATDNGTPAKTGFDIVSITVNPIAANTIPEAKAGRDSTLVLPANSITLSASASTDTDGTISSYEWKEGTTILGTSATLILTGITAGTHSYVLTVTDNSGGVATDTIVVTVAAASVIPSNYIIFFNTVPRN